MGNNNTSSDTGVVRSDGRNMEEDVMIEMEHTSTIDLEHDDGEVEVAAKIFPRVSRKRV